MLRKFINRIVAVFFAISLSVFMLTGCEATRKNDDSIVLRWVTYQASDVPLDIKEVV